MSTAQIELTDAQRETLLHLSRKTGKSEKELLHEAVAEWLEGSDRAAKLRVAQGLWRGRDDLPDFAALRGELDRA